MKKTKILFTFIVVIQVFGIGLKTYAQPKIPKRKIPTDIPSLVRIQIEQLYSSNSAERAVGAFHLGNMGDGAIPAIPFLISILNDYTAVFLEYKGEIEISSVRGEASKALVKIGKPALKPLINALKDNDEDIRKMAAITLGKIKDKQAVKPLIDTLKNDNWEVRSSAAWALGEIRDSFSVESLISALKDKDIRKDAAEALLKIGKPSVKYLVTVLHDENPHIRRLAAEVLAGLKWIPRNDAQKIIYFIAACQWKECAKIGSAAVEPLIEILNAKQAYIRLEATWALGEIRDKRAVNTLVNILKDEFSGVRKNAAEALGKIKDKRAVESLIYILKDNNVDVREKAVWALGEIMDIQAVVPLIIALEDEDSSVRWESAKALGKIKDRRAVESLIEALNDEVEGVRSGPAWALGEIKDKKAIKPLIIAFKSKDIMVQGKIAYALIKIGKPVVKPLIDALKDEDFSVRWNAKVTLEEITKQSFGEDYNAWLKWWEENKEKFLKKK